jgi:acyl-CoA thioester hydrolase
MARIKIQLPDYFPFTTEIAVRITDLNYGAHVGNDSVVSILHEARVQFLQSHGYQEFRIGGLGLIMSDLALEFKQELFYGDRILAHVAAGEFSKVRFELFYKLQRKAPGKADTLVAIGRTGMVCYDYDAKKVASIPEQVQQTLSV